MYKKYGVLELTEEYVAYGLNYDLKFVIAVKVGFQNLYFIKQADIKEGILLRTPCISEAAHFDSCYEAMNSDLFKYKAIDGFDEHFVMPFLRRANVDFNSEIKGDKDEN